MKPATLTRFLDFLQSLDGTGFQGTSVDRFLTDHFVPQEEFLPYIFFREDTYGRNLVYKNDFFELLVLTWLPHQRTKIHDHSGQRCWMTVQLGTLSFKNYATPQTDKCELIPLCGADTCVEGKALYIDDGIGVHSIVNASRKPAVSVHLYAAPISRCKTYNEALKRFEWTDLHYFTEFGQELKTFQPELN